MQKPRIKRKRICLSVWSASGRRTRNRDKICSPVAVERVFGNAEKVPRLERQGVDGWGRVCAPLLVWPKREKQRQDVAPGEADEGKCFCLRRMGELGQQMEQGPLWGEVQGKSERLFSDCVLTPGCTVSLRGCEKPQYPSLIPASAISFFVGCDPGTAMFSCASRIKKRYLAQILWSLNQWEWMKFETFRNRETSRQMALISAVKKMRSSEKNNWDRSQFGVKKEVQKV